jgi:hypothetical protein
LSSHPALLLLYGVTIFTSASLLFLVQPMFARMALPKLGGSPEVWNTCMVFFQAALLAGYGYAHLSVRWLGVRRQAALHLLLLALPLACLPIGIVAGGLSAGLPPTVWLLGVLAFSVGPPFLALSTTAPLVQRWFAETGHRAARDPYFLYAASNLGSMLALVSFPLLVEPNLRLAQQALWWSAGYVGFVLLIAACAVMLWRTPREKLLPLAAAPSAAHGTKARVAAARHVDQLPLDWRLRLRWLLLAFAPASWLLAVTAYVTTHLAPVPLLWIIPLALYLGSFILVFARRPLVPHTWLVRAFPLLTLLLIAPILVSTTLPALALHLLTFLAAALVCHGELARLRPAPEHLTEFYFWMSLGGVLGGAFCGLLAPAVFPWLLEYPLTVALTAMLVAGANVEQASSRRFRLIGLAAMTLTIALMSTRLPPTERPPELVGFAAVSLLLLVGLYLAGLGRWFALVLGLVLVFDQVAAPFSGQVLYTVRGYFGIHRVIANRDAQGRPYHHLTHGGTIHGRQARFEPRLCEPLTYYHPTGPLGDVFAARKQTGSPRQVAIVGLGSGAMACYSDAAMELIFYEIDPLVRNLAETPSYFSFLSDCSPGKYSIVIGDGRLRLAEERDARFDLMIFDAFSSDAVPMHLLTREALALYEQKLAEGGWLVFHASNTHLDLKAALARLADDAGLACLSCSEEALSVEAFRAGKTPSTYVVMARKPSDLAPLAANARWRSPPLDQSITVWTDDFSNLIEVLKW